MHSFFQEFENDGVIRCKMHDIVHEVAQYLSKNECCMIEVKDFREQSMNIALCEKACHLRLMVEGSDTFPTSICNFKKLWSLLIEFDDVGSKLNGKVLPKLFDELTCLKVIDKSFGFDTVVEKAQRAVKAAHVEVESFDNCIGVVKLMGRYGDPTYMIRAIPSNASDNVYCVPLAHCAIHGDMLAGNRKTDQGGDKASFINQSAKLLGSKRYKQKQNRGRIRDQTKH
ncbi:hypothetical protein LWI28_015288 [Acer negundo]|uniref:Uncharacterized protein n=1 Tax=Acer negundo TaxID=4023 RepID=A0AAD5NJS1_ACENE|nr:hypothetical protein LWI28_015288 [Acer negundo]